MPNRQTDMDCSPLNPDTGEWKGYKHFAFTSNGESVEGRLLEQHLDLSHTIDVQKLPQLKNQQLQELLKQQQLQTLAITSPQPEISVFSGDPVEYSNFVRAFENLRANAQKNRANRGHSLKPNPP